MFCLQLKNSNYQQTLTVLATAHAKRCTSLLRSQKWKRCLVEV